MADNTTIDPGTGGDTIRDKDRAGVKTQIVGLDLNPAGSEVLGTGDATNGLDVDVTRVQGTVTVNGSGVTQPVSAAALPLPSGAATAAKQPALGTAGTASADVLSVQGVASMTALKVDGSGVTQPVSGTVTASGPLTDTQLRASAVPVSGTVTASGPLTDTQLRATAVPVSGPLTDTQLRATAVPVSGTVTASGPLTDTQLRATAVPVSGTVTASGPLTDTQLRASAVPISDNSGSLTVDAPVGTPVFTTVTPSATGGWSKIKYAAQTTTVQTPKGTAGTFGGYYAYNPNASAATVQVFDAATATTITLGTTVPDMIFTIPATSGANIEVTNGVNMANGIKLACTTTATGSTAPTTGLDLTIFFK